MGFTLFKGSWILLFVSLVIIGINFYYIIKPSATIHNIQEFNKLSQRPVICENEKKNVTSFYEQWEPVDIPQDQGFIEDGTWGKCPHSDHVYGNIYCISVDLANDHHPVDPKLPLSKHRKQKCWCENDYIVVTMFDNNHEAYRSISEPNKKAYARTRGYAYADETCMHDDDSKRSKAYSKMLAVLHHLHHHRAVLWIDADAVFTNFDIDIEHFLDKYRDSDIIIGKEPIRRPFPSSINSGVMIFKNSHFAHWFAQYIYSYDGPRRGLARRNRWKDQGTLVYLLDFHRELMPRFGFVPHNAKTKLQSFDYNNVRMPSNWKHGDWILHTPGCLVMKKSYRTCADLLRQKLNRAIRDANP
eukprot:gb/GECH01013411.1/.p1 GENE.gb/GECH01013411.1/~~gb/GECH01013411.1/.p1  ORF type:complete len:357 (+),score=59.24 gb/GECH01013411.1/:1-1071(+)